MRNAKAVLLEAALVAAAGMVLALAANALSPRGLRLSRNYFPGSGKLLARGQSHTNSVVTSIKLTSSNVIDATLQRLQQRGLQLITSNDVVALFRDVRYEQ